jgi:hypothetical protein
MYSVLDTVVGLGDAENTEIKRIKFHIVYSSQDLLGEESNMQTGNKKCIEIYSKSEHREEKLYF